MNLSLYGHDGAWLAIDLGITFGGDRYPEHAVMMADPGFLAARRERLAGLVLTHGHEDHIGAVPYLWRRLRCPIYATPFTAALVRHKLASVGIADAPLIVIRPGSRLQIGPFVVESIRMTHSIPESQALLIGTPAGAVLHSGDWKFDDRPVVGAHYDAARLRALRRAPLLALVCDSTNAIVPGRTGSEGELFAALRELAEQSSGRVIVTCFASNIARLVTLARVASALGRRFGVLGQAMQRMIAVAQVCGYWPDDLPELVDARHLGFLPRAEVLIACTGSQGETGSALARHRDLRLEPGDLLVFSSKMIPGNERSVERLQRQASQLGIELITDADAGVHVSGHPVADDLRRLYEEVQPPSVIPVHGTPRHLAANAAIARDCHVPRVEIVRNGDLCRLDPAGPQVIGQVETGRLTLMDGGRLEAVAPGLLREMREAG